MTVITIRLEKVSGERASHDTEIEQQDGRFQTAQGPEMTPTEGLGSGG